MSKPGRSGITILEVVVVLAICLILMGLLVSAVQRVREASTRLQSQNNLRQVMLATQSFAGTNNGRLRLSADTEGGVFTPHTWILPHLGRPEPKVKILEAGSLAEVEWALVPEFHSPADPSLVGEPVDRNVLSSYPANACVFEASPTLHGTITDGTSNTIGFGEHYAMCKEHRFRYTLSGFAGPYGMRRATFADREQEDVHPIMKNGQTIGSAPGKTFQTAPLLSEADGFLANTPHSSGLLAAMLDGSVRTFSSTTSERVFWSAVTPNSADDVGQ